MLKQNKTSDYLQEIFKLLPEDIRSHKEDLRKNIQAAVNARLVKLDLVTREEFDIQSELLSKTRALVDDLEDRITKLESEFKDRKT